MVEPGSLSLASTAASRRSRLSCRETVSVSARFGIAGVREARLLGHAGVDSSSCRADVYRLGCRKVRRRGRAFATGRRGTGHGIGLACRRGLRGLGRRAVLGDGPASRLGVDAGATSDDRAIRKLPARREPGATKHRSALVDCPRRRALQSELASGLLLALWADPQHVRRWAPLRHSLRPRYQRDPKYHALHAKEAGENTVSSGSTGAEYARRRGPVQLWRQPVPRS